MVKGYFTYRSQKVPPVMDAVLKVKLLRENSNREATKKLAEYPMLFGEVRQPEDTYIIIPRHSSQIHTFKIYVAGTSQSSSE